MKKIRNIIKTIPIEFKKKFYFIILINFLVGILEMITIASILPFMIVVINPDSFLNNSILVAISNYFIFENQANFALVMAIIIGLVASISVCFSVFNIWLTNRFIFNLGAVLSSKLFNHYMFLDYNEFIKKPTSELISKIILQTQRYADGVIGSFLIIFQKLSTITILVTLLLIINFKISAVSICILALFYIFFYKKIKKKVSDLGLENTKLIHSRQKILQDNLNCAKELKIYDKENLFIEIFRNLSLKFAENISFNRSVSASPRYFLELLIIILALVFTLFYFTVESGKLIDVVPIGSIFILSIYKIMPAAQSIFSSVSYMNSEIHAYDSFKNDLNTFQEPSRKSFINKNIKFQNIIEFKNLSFSFDDDNNNKTKILDDVSFKIKKNNIIGVFGKSGSGKSTLLNIISSLLYPEKGEMYVDDKKLNREDIVYFKKNIAFVTQSTMVFNDTLEKNITLYDKDIDKNQLNKSIELSGLTNFVKDLPNGLTTEIGEKGSKVSGGQLQRISIARAIYNNRKILLLDEFTSALDPVTESNLLHYIKNLKNTTIVLSTHKLEVLNFCDSVIGLKDGKLILSEEIGKNNQFSKEQFLKVYY